MAALTMRNSGGNLALDVASDVAGSWTLEPALEAAAKAYVLADAEFSKALDEERERSR